MRRRAVFANRSYWASIIGHLLAAQVIRPWVWQAYLENLVSLQLACTRFGQVSCLANLLCSKNDQYVVMLQLQSKCHYQVCTSLIGVQFCIMHSFHGVPRNNMLWPRTRSLTTCILARGSLLITNQEFVYQTQFDIDHSFDCMQWWLRLHGS